MSNDVLIGCSSSFLEELYEKYLKDPEAVGQSWRAYFNELDSSNSSKVNGDNGTYEGPGYVDGRKFEKLLHFYRCRGHTDTLLNPLGFNDKQRPLKPNLNIDSDGQIPSNIDQLEQLLRTAYSTRIGAEFEHVESQEEVRWWRTRFEDEQYRIIFTADERVAILRQALAVSIFENYLHTKFPGMKRFSGEGAEGAVIAIKEAIKLGAARGASEVILGMGHRGRLSTLATVLQKPLEIILAEFLGHHAPQGDGASSGDVKYHMGWNAVLEDNGGVEVKLMSNPSHLESINPIVLGFARSRQDCYRQHSASSEDAYHKILPILVHGDAALAGQGLVMETMALSHLSAFEVGGTVHIVVNNGIGFTTNVHDGRYTRYCTDGIKGYGYPILHVNGNDFEGVVWAISLAIEYRYKFGRDVFIDVNCYRKYGHNESDEPHFTQPQMYKVIGSLNRFGPSWNYYNTLLQEQVIAQADYQEIVSSHEQKLEQAFVSAQEKVQSGDTHSVVHTSLQCLKTELTLWSEDALRTLGQQVLSSIPNDFAVHPKIARQFKAKIEALNVGSGLDWALGEMLAFATLIRDGAAIRLIGQDVERGTFSHRHAVIVDQNNGAQHTILQSPTTVDNNGGSFEVYNSNLSEFGVLGFEYGYSVGLRYHNADNKENSGRRGQLVIWEAQFGDFANGAQVIIDQYIAAGRTKWGQASNITLLLPHGYEGQGPEHSSARLERFLQLCAESNMSVCNCTTPASFYHLLRRQASDDKPLIVMSPKSMLRHKAAVSTLREMADGTSFEPILLDRPGVAAGDNSPISRIIFCSGKVYYDLYEKILADTARFSGVVLVRLEQLYPFPAIDDIIQNNPTACLVWCQEEPANMGAYSFVLMNLQLPSGRELLYAGRPASASPASGFADVHAIEQERLLHLALGE